MHLRSTLRILPSTLALAALLGGCQRQQGTPLSPMATPVEVVTLAEKPVEQITEYVGTVKSRRSTTVQPQVEGFVTKILVRSGAKVQPGTPLLQIDQGMQQAAVANLESQRAARQADLQQAQQQAARMKALLDAGAASQAEFEQAQTAQATAQAALKAIEAQIREQRVALGYHQVTAPTAGVVGDVPVRVGDSVTRSTVLTTIDQQAGLEVYVNVPVQEAAKLKVGLPVRLVDDRGETIASSTLSFVSPAVDPATQSVLAKAQVEDAGRFRTEQFVRVRVVWTQAPALTVPVTAVNRINGQYFAYLAVDEAAGTVVRQRAVEVGEIVGNDYVVRSGLKAGDRLIVSGVQKIREGAFVKPGPPAAPSAVPGESK